MIKNDFLAVVVDVEAQEYFLWLYAVEAGNDHVFEFIEVKEHLRQGQSYNNYFLSTLLCNKWLTKIA